MASDGDIDDARVAQVKENRFPYKQRINNQLMNGQSSERDMFATPERQAGLFNEMKYQNSFEEDSFTNSKTVDGNIRDSIVISPSISSTPSHPTSNFEKFVIDVNNDQARELNLPIS